MTRQVVASRVPFTKDSEVARLAFVAVQYREQVGEALRARRKELGLTQSQVADRVERWLRDHDKREEGKPFDSQNVSRWERGKNLGKTDNLEAVAYALETTVPAIMSAIKPERKERPALNGNQPDDLRAKLDRIESNQRRLLEFFGIADETADLNEAVATFAQSLREQREEGGSGEASTS